jgi:hypothetical protein
VCLIYITLFYPLSLYDKKGSNFYFWIGIVFLTSQVIFVPKWPKGEFVSIWPHSVGQNHFFAKMLFNRDSTIQKCFQKILHSLQVRKFGSMPVVRTTCYTVRMPSCPKHQLSRRRVIPSGRTSV